jgi:anti-anti-sigma factor
MTTVGSARHASDQEEAIPFAASVRAVGDDIEITVSGELDVGARATLEPLLTAAVSFHPARMYVDLTELTFIDGAGAQVLLCAGEMLKKHGGQLILRSPGRLARVIFGLGGIERFASIER